ncbi:trypsin-1 [Anoplophora glabripennis]|uniref:trypsin-1 n=1 Tax=Anoplophora glabripennis TaxID=217634 RepID=UPI000873E250|nr:trypsin-1 [Anoplophora glabripennis]
MKPLLSLQISSVLYFMLMCCLLTSAKREGRNCKLSGTIGICERVKNCPAAVESMKKTFTPGLKRCGFVDQEELVCCPYMKSSQNNEIIHGLTPIKNSKEFCGNLVRDYNSKPMLNIFRGAKADSDEYPHMAALGYPKDNNQTDLEWRCGASIISHKFLLTAAHCIRDKSQISPTIARLGITKLDEKNAQDLSIKKTIMHPEFDAKRVHNDIALIEVNEGIAFQGKTFPACLHFDYEVPSILTATGWGTNGSNSSSFSNALMEADLVSVSNNECDDYYSTRLIEPRNISDTQLCAKYNTGDTCQGDSGGPLQIKINETYFIVGITSFGVGCGENHFGVYTRVSKYVDWIDKIIWLNNIA